MMRSVRLERLTGMERALLAQPAVGDCLVVRRSGPQAGDLVVAYVVPVEPMPQEGLRELLAAPLQAELRPDAYVVLSKLPLLPGGQVDEEALLAMPLLTDEAITRWEGETGSAPGVGRVSIRQRLEWPRSAAVHVGDLLPDWQPRPAGLPVTPRPPGPAAVGAGGPRSAQPALSFGGPLARAPDEPQTLPEALRRAAQLGCGDEIVFVQPDGSEIRQSYAGLLGEAGRIAAGLRQAGLRPGENALLQLESSQEILAAFWGCVLAGVVPAIAAVPPSYGQPHRAMDQLGHVWQVLGRPLIIASRQRCAEADALRARIPIASSGLAAIEELRAGGPDHVGQVANLPETRQIGNLPHAAAPEAGAYCARPDDPLFITFTSGSTSAPKCIRLTHRNVFSRAAGANALGGHLPSDVILNWLPLDHIGSISDWHLRCVLLRCRLVYVPKEYVMGRPLRWLDLMDQYRITHTWAPTFAFALLSESLRREPARPWDLSCVKAFLCAGETVSPAVMERFLEGLRPFGLEPAAIRPAFGMAEMASGVTYFCRNGQRGLQVRRVKRSSLAGALAAADEDDPEAVGFVSLGPPIPGVTLRIVDTEGSVVPEETIGHLQVRGEPVAQGYYNDPQANDPAASAAFRADGWFATGDLGFLSQGELYLTGRAKDCLIIRGANYYCGEIEEVVDAVEGVVPSFSAACAVGGAAADREKLAIFFHTPLAGEELRELLRRIKRQVVRRMGITPDYLVPVPKEAIPKTAIGKVQRRQLAQRFDAGEFDETLKRLDLPAGNENTQPDAAVEQRQSTGKDAAFGDSLAGRIAEIFRDVLELDEVGADDNLFELGGNSLRLVQIHSRLVAECGPGLSLVEMFRYPTVRALAAYLGGQTEAHDLLQQAAERARRRTGTAGAAGTAEVAVIGLACRFPGAEGIDRFWRNLRDGIESITRFSEEEVLAAGVDPDLVRHRRYVRAGPILDGIEQFDAEFFGCTAREAELMDPQHRLFLECAWEAMEDAGYAPGRCPGSVGVFASAVLNTYLLNHVYAAGAYRTGDRSEVLTLSSTGGFQAMVGGDKDYLPTRVSYKLNLRGPSVSVQTACSSSLVAVHLAVQSILSGECDMALAGGVSVSVPQKTGYLYDEGLLVSPDGHCRAFDAAAQGTVFGNGAGVVVLKRLSEALADGDHVYAVIKGSAVNNDGSAKVGYYAPSQDGQAAVVAEALAVAGVSADSISYIEAHGTGTALGDPIEVAGLSQAFRAQTERKQFCAIGSVKTNVGHLQIASGVAGLIKAVLALHHQQLPPSLHFRRPNPQIGFEHSPFFVNAELRPWPEGSGPRRAGVNSLGIGGTNAHVILEEAPALPARENRPELPLHLFTLSARTATALHALAARYAAHLAQARGLSLGDLCFTANAGRAQFSWRLAVVAGSLAELRAALEGFVAGRSQEDVIVGTASETSPPPVPLLLPGEDPEDWRGMRRNLAVQYVRGAQVDWAALDRDYQRRRVVLPTYPFERKRHWIERPSGLSRGAGCQPAGQIGNLPHDVALLGRRVTSPALRDVVFESVLDPQRLPLLGDHRFYGTPILPGACQLMMVLEALRRLRSDSLCTLRDVRFTGVLAVPEGTARTVQLILSDQPGGETSFQLVSRPATGLVEDEGWSVHAVGRVVPAHSAGGDGASRPLPDRDRFIATCQRQWDQAEFYESLRGHQVALGRRFRVVRSAWLGDAAVLARLEMPEGLEEPGTYPLHPVLIDACLQVLGGVAQCDADRTLVPAAIGRFCLVQRPQTDQLWCHVQIEGPTAAPGPYTVNVRLFEHDRVIATIDGLRYQAVPREVFWPLVGKDIRDWLYRETWMPQPRPPDERPSADGQSRPWLIFTDRGGLGDNLATLLRQRGQQPLLVEAGDEYRRCGADRYVVKPAQREHFRQLLDDLEPAARPLQAVVYLWALDAAVAPEPSATQAAGGVLHLVQALLSRPFSRRVLAAESPGEDAEAKRLPVLCLVTQGAQPVDASGQVVQPAQATLWGLARTIALEHPEMDCLRVDLDPDGGTEQAAWLLDEVNQRGQSPFSPGTSVGNAGSSAAKKGTVPEIEPEVGYRGSTRFVRRLERHAVDLPQPLPVRADGTYLISGGTGALGGSVAGWLVERGARHLVLVSRRGELTPPAQRAVESWRQNGTRIEVFAADVCDREAMSRIAATIRSDMPALRGIFHAAGVLDDGILLNQTCARLQQVMAAKVQGAWNLHELTADATLDFFVAFSSIASLLGSPGQAGYAAANAFLDALMHYRRGLGLPGLAINWGPWAGEGMAAGLKPANQQRLAERGFAALSPEEALWALSHLLGTDAAQVAVAKIDWMRYCRQLGGKPAAPLLEALIPAGPPWHARDERLPQLRQGPPEALPARVLETVRSAVCRLLGADPAAPIELDRGFYDLGMDSLSIMQLRNRLQDTLGVPLPATFGFQYPNIASLADYLAEKLGGLRRQSAAEVAAEEPSPTRADTTAPSPSDLDGLSEEELAERLAERLAAIRGGDGHG